MKERNSVLSEIADRAEAIYAERFQARYEAEHPGKFVAIDINSRGAWVDERAEGAIQNARSDAPYGVFHLIRVGQPTALRTQQTRRETLTNYW